jgi:predicted  nucleic acid-binding Zn-ribbon protein
MDNGNSTPQKPSIWRRFLLSLKRLVLFLFKVLLIVLVVGALGAALYYGAPVLIDEYLLKDVKLNSSRIQEIDSEFSTSSEFFSERLKDLQTRLEKMELQRDSDAQLLGDLQVQLGAAEGTLQEQGVSLEGLDAVQISLDELSATIDSLEERITSYEVELGAFQDEVEALSQALDGHKGEYQALKDQVEARDTVGALRQDLELLKIMELVTRVRVSIGQENIGLAKDDLQAAQDLLNGLSAEVTAGQAEYLADISQRLTLADENLTEAPGLVSGDLEVAWQLLLQGLPEATDQGAGITPTPIGTTESETEVEQSPTPTPTPGS